MSNSRRERSSYSYLAWELEYRPRLAIEKGVDFNEIKSDIMGDLREIRHAILHAKGLLSCEKHRKLTKLGEMFPAEQNLIVSYEEMHQIFILVKLVCARLMFEWLKASGLPFDPQPLKT